MVVEFTDNMLLPSSNGVPDLLIYFPMMSPGQAAMVEISSDNENWIPVGTIGTIPMHFAVEPYPAPFPYLSYRALIDIDIAGLDSETNYKFVRISDVSYQYSVTPTSLAHSAMPGVMIDAVEANPMHTVNTEEIPEFPTVALPVAAIIGIAFFFQRRKE
ncbi:PEF-CTERM sorting domain-containing protein [Methanococcoides sp. SA1]|nr:PEF-CTERM sorting domain-containing protein [Methanococcoides sp. SA1]